MDFKITNNIDDVMKRIGTTTQKKLMTAAKQAIDDVAFQAKKDLRQYAEKVFDNPVALTKNPALVTKAKIHGNTASGSIWLKQSIDVTKGTSPTQYLQAQIKGGQRADKRSEKLLQMKGILPHGYQTTVMDAYKNKNGNITRGLIQKILSDLQSYSYSGSIEQNRPARYYKPRLSGRAKYKTTKGNKTVGKYIVIPVHGKRGRNKAPGIYERKGKRMHRILAFIPRPTYRSRYDFFWSVLDTVKPMFRRRFKYRLLRQHKM
jgi:hypothetical protein